jgi:glycine/D-amino acid oxidase-like deaminating enzyme
MPHHSPWLQQLNRTRPVDVLERDEETDVAIIGGGIAGVSTAFWTLQRTTKRVFLVEAGKVAHGATGHNAGQVVSYIERPFHSLAAEFGIKKAAAALRDVKNAWHLLDTMMHDAQLTTPLHSFTGYAGFVHEEQVLAVLEDLWLQATAGLAVEFLFLADDAPFSIPERYREVYQQVPRAHVLELLEAKDVRYCAALAGRKGVMNSAHFCEELVGWMLATYSERFTLVEHTPVERIVLRHHERRVETKHHVIRAHEVVLCTNGFRDIHIINETGADIDASFHEHIHGTVGAMVGFAHAQEKPPCAIAYVQSASHNEPYFYLTRRSFNHFNLVCVGGPEVHLPDSATYSVHQDYLPHAQDEIDAFLEQTSPDEKKLITMFRWHGLMGYTKTGLRIVGREPLHEQLFYNLGCNGVGILLSIYGGNRVARMLAGDALAPSVFDPQDARDARTERTTYKPVWFPASIAGP